MIQWTNEAITVFQSALFQTTCTVVNTKDFVLVVDPNWLPQEIEEIKQHVESVQGDKEVYLLFTHGDFDHVMGYGAFSGAKVIGSEGLHEHPEKEKKLELIRSFNNDYYIEWPYPLEFPKVDVVIKEDGQQLTLGETTLTFYLAGGHTQDGLFTVIEPLDLWIAGDYLSDFELPFIYHSAKAYQETLEKCEAILVQHSVKLLVPGHGKVTSDSGEMRRRMEASENYLNLLIQAVKEDDSQMLAQLEDEMAYPSAFTKQCHVENVAIVRREFL